jgi:hypothetical protein
MELDDEDLKLLDFILKRLYILADEVIDPYDRPKKQSLVDEVNGTLKSVLEFFSTRKITHENLAVVDLLFRISVIIRKAKYMQKYQVASDFTGYVDACVDGLNYYAISSDLIDVFLIELYELSPIGKSLAPFDPRHCFMARLIDEFLKQDEIFIDQRVLEYLLLYTTIQFIVRGPYIRGVERYVSKVFSYFTRNGIDIKFSKGLFFTVLDAFGVLESGAPYTHTVRYFRNKLKIKVVRSKTTSATDLFDALLESKYKPLSLFIVNVTEGINGDSPVLDRWYSYWTNTGFLSKISTPGGLVSRMCMAFVVSFSTSALMDARVIKLVLKESWDAIGMGGFQKVVEGTYLAQRHLEFVDSSKQALKINYMIMFQEMFFRDLLEIITDINSKEWLKYPKKLANVLKMVLAFVEGNPKEFLHIKRVDDLFSVSPLERDKFFCNKILRSVYRAKDYNKVRGLGVFTYLGDFRIDDNPREEEEEEKKDYEDIPMAQDPDMFSLEGIEIELPP